MGFLWEQDEEGSRGRRTEIESGVVSRKLKLKHQV